MDKILRDDLITNLECFGEETDALTYLYAHYLCYTNNLSVDNIEDLNIWSDENDGQEKRICHFMKEIASHKEDGNFYSSELKLNMICLSSLFDWYEKIKKEIEEHELNLRFERLYDKIDNLENILGREL